MKQVFLHIGHPKTATSLLQRSLFNQHPEINNLGKPNKKWLDYIKLLMTELDDEKFSKKLPELEIKHNTIYLDDEKPNIISDEGFLSPFPRNCNSLVNLTKMSEVFKLLPGKYEIKVILTIRRQANLILSQYANGRYLFTKLNKNWGNFDEMIKFYFADNKEESRELGFYDSFKPYRTFMHLVYLFGEENIKVLVYEQFAQEPEAFIKELSDYLGVDSKISNDLLRNSYDNITPKTDRNEYIVRTSSQAGQKRYLTSGILKQFLKPIELIKNFNHKLLRLNHDLKLIPLKQRLKYRYNDLIRKEEETISVNLSKEQRTAIKKYYFQDNANINKKLNLNMEKWDYF